MSTRHMQRPGRRSRSGKLLLLAFIAAVAADARLVFHDGFVAGTDLAGGEYIANPGDDSSGRYKLQDGQNPVNGAFGGSWQHITAAWDFRLTPAVEPVATLRYPGVVSTGHAVHRRWPLGTSYRPLSPAMRRSGVRVIFVSFLFKLDDATAQGRIEFCKTPEADMSGVGLDINHSVAGEITPYGAGKRGVLATAPDTDTHLVVIKFELSDKMNRFTIWYDPDDLAAGEDNPYFHRGTAPSLQLNYLVLRRMAGGTAGHGMIFDELRIATRWSPELFEGTLE
jgi:hypothetical protein